MPVPFRYVAPLIGLAVASSAGRARSVDDNLHAAVGYLGYSLSTKYPDATTESLIAAGIGYDFTPIRYFALGARAAAQTNAGIAIACLQLRLPIDRVELGVGLAMGVARRWYQDDYARVGRHGEVTAAALWRFDGAPIDLGLEVAFMIEGYGAPHPLFAFPLRVMSRFRF